MFFPLLHGCRIFIAFKVPILQALNFERICSNLLKLVSNGIILMSKASVGLIAGL